MAAALTVPTNDLTGNTIATTYDQLLILDDAAGMINSTLRIVSTQTGHSALQITNDQVLIKDASTVDIASVFEVQDKDANVILSVNGTNNRVGIGTNAPQAKLDITGNSDSVAALKIGPANTTHGWMFYERNTDGDLYIKARASDVETLVIALDRSSGKVGIGETPFKQFSVRGSSNVTSQISFGRTSYKQWFFTPESSDSNDMAIGHVDSDGSGNSTQRLVITDAGNVGIGTDAPAYPLEVARNGDDTLVAFFKQEHVAGWGIGIRLGDDNPAATEFYIVFQDAGANVEGSISGNAANPGIDVNGTSDRRLKENIVTIPDAMSIISQIKPRNFKWKEGSGDIGYGFIADEWFDVFPDSVIGQRDSDGNLIPDAMTTNEDGEVVMDRQMIGTKNIIPVLVKAVQELSAKVTALENNNEQTGESNNGESNQGSDNSGESSSESSGEDSGGAEGSSSDSSSSTSGASETS